MVVVRSIYLFIYSVHLSTHQSIYIFRKSVIYLFFYSVCKSIYSCKSNYWRRIVPIVLVTPNPIPWQYFQECPKKCIIKILLAFKALVKCWSMLAVHGNLIFWMLKDFGDALFLVYTVCIDEVSRVNEKGRGGEGRWSLV